VEGESRTRTTLAEEEGRMDVAEGKWGSHSSCRSGKEKDEKSEVVENRRGE